MDPEIIRKRVFRLPLSTIGRVALQDQKWEADEGRTHFIVNRYPVGDTPDKIMTYMLIYGEENERKHIVEDFSKVLGDPAFHSALHEKSPNSADSVTWITE